MASRTCSSDGSAPAQIVRPACSTPLGQMAVSINLGGPFKGSCRAPLKRSFGLIAGRFRADPSRGYVSVLINCGSFLSEPYYLGAIVGRVIFANEKPLRRPR